MQRRDDDVKGRKIEDFQKSITEGVTKQLKKILTEELHKIREEVTSKLNDIRESVNFLSLEYDDLRKKWKYWMLHPRRTRNWKWK
jgi:hypothetical protein